MSKFFQYWADLRGSFWFLPSIIISGSVLLAFGLIELESWVSQGALIQWPRLFVASPEGARSVLMAIAGSMMTVAGLVFSITLVVLSLASSQYSSRVLRNFMLDRVNQTVLGVFLGVFAYCLVVLRRVEGTGETFVPSIAILGGLIFGLVAIGVLVLFIHHISKAIQASRIVAVVYRETKFAVDHLFPEALGDEEDEPIPEPELRNRTWYEARARSTGYARAVAGESMMEYADKHNVVLRMEIEVGDFVVENTPVLAVLAAEEPSDDHLARLADMVMTGRQRTSEQDVAFGLRQLVDVGLKALSPGVNDTTTATMCVDYLTAILVQLSERRLESHLRGENGDLLVITQGPTYEELVSLAYRQIRESAEGNATVLLQQVRSIGVVSGFARAKGRQAVLRTQLDEVLETIRRTIKSPDDRERVEAAALEVSKALGSPAGSKA